MGAAKRRGVWLRGGEGVAKRREGVSRLGGERRCRDDFQYEYRYEYRNEYRYAYRYTYRHK